MTPVDEDKKKKKKKGKKIWSNKRLHMYLVFEIVNMTVL